MIHEIYLDANATSAVAPAAVSAATQAMCGTFGNPSSSHAAGLRAGALLDATRARARRIVGAGAGQLTFNSGATEGIQTAVLSALCALRERRAAGEPCGDLLLYGATEHKAVPASLEHWNRLLGAGFELRALPVGADGRHRLEVLRELVPRAALVCTMAANNETGVVSDLAGIEAVLRESGSAAYWLVDCVQALGKLPLDLASTRIDYAPFSGHKLYAPKGIGMLYVRQGAPYTPLIAGGGQEAGQRSGTENMAGIAAFGAVLELLESGGVFLGHAQMEACRDRLAHALRRAFPGVVFNAPLVHSLPTTLNFSVPGVSGKMLLDLFDAAGVRVSAGSACSAANAAPSYVLEAMQLPDWRAASAVRMSFGPLADDALIDAACERIAHCGDAMRTACLAPSVVLPQRSSGVVQLSADGRSGWLLFDAATGGCVAIDPPAPLAARIAALVGTHGYRMHAILGTDASADGAAARALLRTQLGSEAVAGDPVDAFGWPGAGQATSLGDGTRAGAVALGATTLARVFLAGDAGVAYLWGEGAAGRLPPDAVHAAFAGMAAARAALVQPLAALIDEHTVICCALESNGLPLTSLAAERQRVPGTPEQAMQLDGDQAERFLREHPDALLIDVREAPEHAACMTGFRGRTACNVPLSRLAEHMAWWLRHESRPFVFFCRSGNRSAKAAESMRRLGYHQAWHLAGGLALAA